MNNEPVAYIDPYDLERLPHYDCHIGIQQLKNGIPLYTQQRPHNTVLVPCDKLAEMQAEIEALKAKLNKYHLKEDLDRNLNLIYGKEFIK